MTEKDEERYRNTNNCRFLQKKMETVEVRDQCHLTGK